MYVDDSAVYNQMSNHIGRHKSQNNFFFFIAISLDCKEKKIIKDYAIAIDSENGVFSLLTYDNEGNLWMECIDIGTIWYQYFFFAIHQLLKHLVHSTAAVAKYNTSQLLMSK